jgi:hypothetical protein
MYHRKLLKLFSESDATFCQHSQGQMAALGLLKRVTERIFKHGKVISKRQAKTLILFYFHQQVFEKT